MVPYDDRPAAEIAWGDASRYCNWVGGSLPTEADWEYAARAGSRSIRYQELDAVAWFWTNSGGHAHEAATKRPNAFGLYDMLGNVSEWCADWFDFGYFQGSPDRDPPGGGSGPYRAVRGGSWQSTERDIRVSFRYGFLPDGRYSSIGFRCILQR
jgi:sulfatase modifying factor 1